MKHRSQASNIFRRAEDVMIGADDRCDTLISRKPVGQYLIALSQPAASDDGDREIAHRNLRG